MSFHSPNPPGHYPPQGPPFGAPSQHAVPPVHGYGYGPPAVAPAQGFNPWAAGAIGVVIGGFLASVVMFVLPMLLFMGVMGSGTFAEGFDTWAPTGRVAVSPDGSVSGPALAEALAEGEFYYEDVTCPATPTVAADVTTICDGSDGFEDLRIVVVFEGDGGTFRTADLFGGD